MAYGPSLTSGQKSIYVIDDVANADYPSWPSTQIGASGITAAGLLDLPPIPLDLATTNATATQLALNDWAQQVSCSDPVFPLNVDGDYGKETQCAAALFQLYTNETGQPIPPLVVDGLAGKMSWTWLQSFGATPQTVTPAAPPQPAPGPVSPAVPSSSGGLSRGAKIGIGAGVGLAILATLYFATE